MRSRQRQFEVHATRECIDSAERNSLYRCLYALAIILSIPGSNRISVDSREVRFSFKGHRYIFPTPERAAEIAEAFDSGSMPRSSIQPWTDILKDPISIELIQHRRPKRRSESRKRMKKAAKSQRCTRWNGGRI